MKAPLHGEHGNLKNDVQKSMHSPFLQHLFIFQVSIIQSLKTAYDGYHLRHSNHLPTTTVGSNPLSLQDLLSLNERWLSCAADVERLQLLENDKRGLPVHDLSHGRDFCLNSLTCCFVFFFLFYCMPLVLKCSSEFFCGFGLFVPFFSLSFQPEHEL